MDNILKLQKITKHFDGLKVIDSLNMTVTNGTISAIIGPNGTGKTTLFNLVCGFLSPDKGKITYKDKDINNLSAWERSSIGIGRLFQDIRVFKKLTLIENLQVTFNDSYENPLKAIFKRRNRTSFIFQLTIYGYPLKPRQSVIAMAPGDLDLFRLPNSKKPNGVAA